MVALQQRRGGRRGTFLQFFRSEARRRGLFYKLYWVIFCRIDQPLNELHDRPLQFCPLGLVDVVVIITILFNFSASCGATRRATLVIIVLFFFHVLLVIIIGSNFSLARYITPTSSTFTRVKPQLQKLLRRKLHFTRVKRRQFVNCLNMTRTLSLLGDHKKEDLVDVFFAFGKL